MRELYSDTFSCVYVDGQPTDWFEVESGVRQGYTIASVLFLVPMHWLLQPTVHWELLGVIGGNEAFTDLDFADDVAVIAETVEALLLTLEVM